MGKKRYLERWADLVAQVASLLDSILLNFALVKITCVL